MPASRPAWRGQIRLSLVSIAVELYPAQTEARTRFRMIHQPTMQPVHYEKVVDGIGAVEPETIIKGFEYEKGEHVLLSEDELDAVKLETKRTLELSQFVELSEIDPVYFSKAYYVQPADDLAEDAYVVIRDALQQGQKVGIGQITMNGKEHLAALQASGEGLVLNTLHYKEELKDEREFFGRIDPAPADEAAVKMAMALMERQTEKFDIAAFHNHYEDSVKELITAKLKTHTKRSKPKAEPAEPIRGSSNVIDLMASLKRSIEQAPAAEAKPSAPRRAAAAKAPKAPSTSSKAPAKRAPAKRAPAKKAG
ncbi:MAG: Ku protein [Devosia sp.]|jgi:DNA end-binding protein Ku|nr:Ku protein [Devosia sp.]